MDDEDKPLDQQDALKSYLSTKYATTPPVDITPATNVEEPTPGDGEGEQIKDSPYDDASDTSGVDSARAAQSRGDLIANIGRSLSQIATARGQANGYKPDNSVYDGMISQNQRDVQNAQSDRQNAIRDYLQKNQLARQGVTDQYAANVERRAQGAYDRAPIKEQADRDFKDKELDLRLKTNKEIADTRAQAAADAAAQRRIIADSLRADREGKAEDVRTEKHSKELDSDERKLSEALDPNKARAGLKGDLQNRINSANRASALIYDEQGKVKDLNPEQMGEAASAWAQSVGGKSALADGAVQRLLPHTASGEVAGIKQWITGEPQGAGQQAFVKLMAETIKREKGVADNALKAAQVQAAGGYHKLQEERPDQYSHLLQSAGIDQENIDKRGQYNPGWAGPPSNVAGKPAPSLPAQGGSSSYPKKLTNGTHTAIVNSPSEEQEAAGEGFK